MAEEVVGQTDPGTEPARIVVVVGAALGAAAEAGEIQVIHAAGVNERKLAFGGEAGIKIANVAVAVIEGAEKFGAKAEVEGQVLCGFPVVLHENAEIVVVILVIGKAATAETELRRAEEKILEVGVAVWGVGEKEFAVEDLRKVFVEIDEGHLTADADNMRALDPTESIDDGNVVLGLRLIAEGSRADFEAGTGKDEFVNGISDAVGGAIDAQVAGGNWRNVVEVVVDVDKAEAQFVDEGGREKMGFGDVQETRVNGRIERKVEKRC